MGSNARGRAISFRAACVALLLVLGSCGVDEQRVWFTPNLGSADMLQLFAEPELWKRTRARIDVFKFYSQQTRPDAVADCGACGANRLSNLARLRAFAQLGEWGIDIAVEAGAVKPWGCTADVTAAVALEAIEGVQANRGTVRFLAMDEPLIGGEPCGYTLEASAAQTAAFVSRIHAARPGILVGEIEPYPYFDVATLQVWLSALIDRGARPAFFHLDVDHVEARRRGVDVGASLQALSRFCQERSIPFGVLFFSLDARSDAAYYEDVAGWIRSVAEAIGEPRHAVFQSFAEASDGSFAVPMNLPERDPAVFSHTRLVGDGLALLSATARKP